MIRPGPIATLALAALAVGCGSGDTETVTETVTVEAEAPASGEASPDEFCASDAADALAQGSGESQAAVNDGDVPAMKKATAKVFKAAEDAPAGAPCAVEALNALADNWNFGASGNFEGVDIPAQVKRIRAFQAKRELR